MKINEVGSGRGPSSVKRKKSEDGKGSAFASALRHAAGGDEASAVVETGPVRTVDAVLALQESDDATERRARAQVRQYGESLLDRLDAIRHDLLMGAVPKSRLAEMAQSMRAHRARCQDPRLMDLIDDIELRCEVEIAKLTR